LILVGDLEYKQFNFEEAMTYFEELRAILVNELNPECYSDTESLSMLSHCLYRLGEIYANLENIGRSVEYRKQAKLLGSTSHISLDDYWEEVRGILQEDGGKFRELVIINPNGQ
jgi:tetratricopeptide (TPR) repeat protein